jgi:uncharacterized protein YjbI with pentapeptide repeats
MRMKSTAVAAVVAALLGTGSAYALGDQNGTGLNLAGLNGTSFNLAGLNGASLNLAGMNGANLNGTTPDAVAKATAVNLNSITVESVTLRD